MSPSNQNQEPAAEFSCVPSVLPHCALVGGYVIDWYGVDLMCLPDKQILLGSEWGLRVFRTSRFQTPTFSLFPLWFSFFLLLHPQPCPYPFQFNAVRC